MQKYNNKTVEFWVFLDEPTHDLAMDLLDKSGVPSVAAFVRLATIYALANIDSGELATPPASRPRQVKVRVRPAVKREIEACAAALGVSVSAFVATAVFNFARDADSPRRAGAAQRWARYREAAALVGSKRPATPVSAV